MGRALVTIALGAGAAHADDRRLVELGAGAAFDVLGSYDVGNRLGGAAVRNDLGPGTLGVYVAGGIWLTEAVIVGVEGTLSVGGLVRTDQRYYGEASNVGSTSTVSSKLTAGWRGLQHGRIAGRAGTDAGIERMSEATGAGFVHVDSIVGGPWIGVELGKHIVVQLRADLHVPIRAEISKQSSGDPSGVFFSGGVRAAFVFGVGPRLRTSAGTRAAPSAAPAAAE
jgi:hypothetical protein